MAGWIGAVLGLAACPAMADSALDRPCPVDWRGQPFSEALPQLAGRLQVPYVLDIPRDDPLLQARVRLSAAHLTGAQALRWLARMAGLEGVLVDGTLLVAHPERLPKVWRTDVPGARLDASGQAPADGGGLTAPWSRADLARWQVASTKRADLNWLDTPISTAARDISSSFGIDLIVLPEIAAEQKLLQLEQAQADLTTVCSALGEQLGASLAYVDGALWAWTPAGDSQARGLVRSPTTQPVSSAPSAAEGAGLAGLLTLDRTVTTWPAFAERVAAASGFRCQVAGVPQAGNLDIEAVGSVGDILEGARLLGRLSWSLATATDGPFTLHIKVTPTSPEIP